MILKNFTRCFAKQVPKNLKGKSKSSQEWLTRQLADPYVEKAHMLNYRCRSAFKLIEIDDKYKIIKPGDVIVDCGAAPGSWSQVAVERSNSKGSNKPDPKGMVIGIDLLHFANIEGVLNFGGMDFTTSQPSLIEALDGRLVNCVLSDMAPNATGIRMLDQENIVTLCYAVLRFAVNMSTIGGHLVMKLWDNGEAGKLERDVSNCYEKVKRVKPNSSRSDSAEMFLVARGFKGKENILKNIKSSN